MKIVWKNFEYNLNKFTNRWEKEGVEEDYEDVGESISELSLEDFMNAFDDSEEKRFAVSTPFGIFDVEDPFSPIFKHELWIGYTDFNVDQNFILSLSKIRGIEAVKAVSRYSFIIGIGKLFSFTQVRIAIEMMLGMHHEGEYAEVQECFDSIKDDKFAIYIYPNGTYESASVKESSYPNKLREFLRKKDGILLTNE